jgi:2'-5' RNA ligase
LKSKFLITHNLQGQSAELARTISADVSSECGVADPHRRIPPHVTLKSPFRADNEHIEQLGHQLKQFAKEKNPGTIAIDQFGHFNKRIIYLDITADKKTRTTVDALTEQLKKLAWLNLDKHDKHVLLHSTIARARSDAEFDTIWNYLQAQYQPDIKAKFDNISVLQLDAKKDEWNVYKEFSLE